MSAPAKCARVADDDERARRVWGKLDAILQSYCLSDFGMVIAKRWLRRIADPSLSEFGRLRPWVLMLLNGRLRAPPTSAWQSGCPELLPNLTAQPVWDRALFPWLANIEASSELIARELLALRGQQGFQPLRIPTWASKNAVDSTDGHGQLSHDAGDWNVFYLSLHEVAFERNRALCPRTCELLATVPRAYEHAFFSALTPGTHIIKHHGPTNKKLRIHLPLVGVSGARMRVADHVYEAEAGRALVFDDSFEHEAWHDGNATRIVLVFDIWHPDLSDAEVKFLAFLQSAKMRAEMAADAQQPEGESFYRLLVDSSRLLGDNDWWVDASHAN